MSYSKQSYQARFFSTMEKMYNEMETCHPDVTLLCVDDGVQKKCHGFVLSVASKYFANVLSYSASDLVEVHNGIRGDTLDVVLRFIYFGKITLNLDNVTDVLVAADYFNIPEIVALCVPIISESLATLDLQSLLDLFLLSWKLRLLELSEEIAPLLALYFPEILNDSILKTQLMTFSPQLMSLLLKSDELVFIDKETNLPTGPAEREKGVLEMILCYVSHLKNTHILISGDEISNLLGCVKWAILNIFGEEEYVFNIFANKLDSGKRKEELQDLYDVIHSEWYCSSSSLSPLYDGIFEGAEEMDRKMYGTRAYTCSQLVTSKAVDDLDVPYSYSNLKDNFKVNAKKNEQLSGLDIFLRSARTKSSGETHIVGGIVAHITSGNEVISHHHGIPEEKASHVHKIKLKKGEYITNVSAIKHMNTYTYPFKCQATGEQSFGPFGGDKEHPVDDFEVIRMFTIKDHYSSDDRLFQECEEKRIDVGPRACSTSNSVLVGVKGRLILIEDYLSIKDIKFIYRKFLPSSNLLINSEKEFGRLYDCDIEYDGLGSDDDYDYNDYDDLDDYAWFP